MAASERAAYHAQNLYNASSLKNQEIGYTGGEAGHEAINERLGKRLLPFSERHY